MRRARSTVRTNGRDGAPSRYTLGVSEDWMWFAVVGGLPSILNGVGVRTAVCLLWLRLVMYPQVRRTGSRLCRGPEVGADP